MNFRKILYDECKPAFATLGYRKRTGGLFTCDLTENIIGILGLNDAYHGDGYLEINPVIGLRNQTIERLLAEIKGEKFDSCIPATLSTPIGYVMPRKTFKVWVLHATGDNTVNITEIVSALRDYALPFLRELIPLPALLEMLLSMRYGWPNQHVYRIPAVWYLLGEYDKAAESLVQMEQIAGKWVPMERFLAFTARFRAYMSEHVPVK